MGYQNPTMQNLLVAFSLFASLAAASQDTWHEAVDLSQVFVGSVVADCGAQGNCDHNGMINSGATEGPDAARIAAKYCDNKKCGDTDESGAACKAKDPTAQSLGWCGSMNEDGTPDKTKGGDICRYQDDLGCKTSDPDGCYCKKSYDKRKAEQEKQMAANCGGKDCTSEELAKFGVPVPSCAAVKEAGYCSHPMAQNVCPETCASA